ncbi:MAG: YcfA-like protein [Phormidesmis priestleyi Ana]|uniref:YcfA-like protein n=1 Tax=Phormidesmis priestleyi Ana TaxID=1666911 RepID=A0A0P7ZYG2_9CYAN|nr:MAG: YcfA-like protein [Phormidesmis priestleyi Ana]
MNNKLKKTLKAIFEHPTRSDVAWADIEKLFEELGAHISEGKGSRVRILLKDEIAVFHRPHPKRTVSKACLKSVQEFLQNAGVQPP